MRCLNDKRAGEMRWRGCLSRTARRDWGYCRQRNIDAGGMKNVTPEMQAGWRKEDNAEALSDGAKPPAMRHNASSGPAA